MEKTFKLKITMGNDAFVEDENQELSRILKSVAQRLEGGEVSGTLRDINGNNVGRFSKVMQRPVNLDEVVEEMKKKAGLDSLC